MINSGRNIVLMLVGVVMVAIGCEAKPLSWAEVLEQNPDPKVVTDADFLKRIMETKLPWRVKDKFTGMEMLLVPPGKFMMGASPGDEYALEVEKLLAEQVPQSKYSERPQHEVTITKAFYLGRNEVTQEQWLMVMGQHPSLFQQSNAKLIAEVYLSKAFVDWTDIKMTAEEAKARADSAAKAVKFNPVEVISWDDCQKFCAKTGMILPTEAQWEYACRAGVDKATYGELDQIAWNFDNANLTTHSVGQKAPNALGFYDMIGNVNEWCQDWYEGDYYKSCEGGVVDPTGPAQSELGARVLRGGGWRYAAGGCRASYRYSFAPGYQNDYLGCRFARTP
ncbi:MAG: formylglycine-generating enzyme family protein [Planctomycetota bacterium]|nr:formylglycine-generating enzyme family protein [Planctomycetota bacterium]